MEAAPNSLPKLSFKSSDLSSITLQWSGANPECSYRVEYLCADAEQPDWSKAKSLATSSGKDTHEITLVDLEASTSYLCRLYAVPGDGSKELGPTREVVFDTEVNKCFKQRKGSGGGSGSGSRSSSSKRR